MVKNAHWHLGDLTRRLVLANPSLDDPLLGEGIVLIDEIELHMHPKWQRRIIGVLKEVFPNIQFIITTHSPQVLGEIGEGFKLYKLENLDGLSITEYDRLDGWDNNDILQKETRPNALAL